LLGRFAPLTIGSGGKAGVLLKLFPVVWFTDEPPWVKGFPHM